MRVKNWSNEQVNDVFERLGLLKNQGNKFDRMNEFVEPPKREIILPQLSDNSVPLPTGRITDANVEKFSR